MRKQVQLSCEETAALRTEVDSLKAAYREAEQRWQSEAEQMKSMAASSSASSSAAYGALE